jgi:penicillin-binding protein 1C
MPIYQEIFQKKNMLVAFKTGTSYGFRDAWCLGYTKNYTVGIWVGSPPGIGDSNLVGMYAATPIMIKVAGEIWNDTETSFVRPRGILIRDVCSLSGALPTKDCPQTVRDLAIKNVTKPTLCQLHKKIDGRLYIAWPPQFSNWLLNYENVFTAQNSVKIIRPVSGHTVILQNGESERVFLSAEGDAPHYWYLDGKFIGISPDGRGLFADVARGSHKASVLSGESSDTVSFEVKNPSEINENLKGQNLNILN